MAFKNVAMVMTLLCASVLTNADQVRYGVIQGSIAGAPGIVASCLCNKPVYVMMSVPDYDDDVQFSFYVFLGITKAKGNVKYPAACGIDQLTGKETLEVSTSDPIYFEANNWPTGCTISVRVKCGACTDPRVGKLESHFKTNFRQSSHIDNGPGVIVIVYRDRACENRSEGDEGGNLIISPIDSKTFQDILSPPPLKRED
jgi:hypothetical protein